MLIVYDCTTGNTEKAAGYVLEGVRSAGASGGVRKAGKARNEDSAGAKGIVIGAYRIRDRCSSDIMEFIASPPRRESPAWTPSMRRTRRRTVGCASPASPWRKQEMNEDG